MSEPYQESKNGESKGKSDSSRVSTSLTRTLKEEGKEYSYEALIAPIVTPGHSTLPSLPLASTGNVPAELTCQLSHQLLVEPVVTARGIIYDRDVISQYLLQETSLIIEEHIATDIPTDPSIHVSRCPLSGDVLTIDMLRSADDIVIKLQEYNLQQQLMRNERHY